MNGWPFGALIPGSFKCAVVDPPWAFKARTALQMSNPGSRRDVERHYEVMDLAAIKALPVGQLLGKHAHLWLWTTGPMLPVAFCPEVFVDSGAFRTIEMFGGYPNPPSAYAAEITRLVVGGIVNVVVAVAEDYMCEPFMLAKTGLTVEDHQRLTIERYDALLACAPPALIMPVLQGYAPDDYARHVRAYGDRLTPGMWVGVGSVCKRQGDPKAILAVLYAIKRERPDLRLHGFGVKKTALEHDGVRELFYSADSAAWSYAARREKGNAHDPADAQAYADRLAEHFARPWQPSLPSI